MILPYLNSLKGKKKAFAWLIDPDKSNDDHIKSQLTVADDNGVDLIFVGGSLTFKQVDHVIMQIKSFTKIPVVLFPGSPLQLSSAADAVLLLSLISGRNAEYLIGNHVIAAPFLKESGLEIIPTGYMLIHGGQQTSVSYMSNTQPIPSDKPDIALATAMAGEMLGLKTIYLDAGSGALNPVPMNMITPIASAIDLPVIIGGGIRTSDDIRNAYTAGADVVVVGNAIENSLTRLAELIVERDRFNT
ncbi:MAG: geranylgeranylglyceryl/heptaprenylglyceryl phosphate synthase [Bacteroidales bacterium]|nr:geranylgeranylglyceryl/heptaprenylglyceryl phosphate synthase [Bacteroidales bacterium]